MVDGKVIAGLMIWGVVGIVLTALAGIGAIGYAIYWCIPHVRIV